MRHVSSRPGNGSEQTTPLRICMLAACPFPANHGTPGSIREMAEAICGLGHEVHIVTYHQGENIPLDGPILHRIRALFRERAVVVGPTVRRPLYDLQMVFETRKVIRRYRPHLIHAHGYEAALAGWLARLGMGLPLLYSGHNTMADELPSYRFIRPRALALAAGQLLDAVVPRLPDRCLPHSANLDRFFRAMGLGARVEPVVNFGINLEKFRGGDAFAVRQKYGLTGRPVVLYSGVLDEFQRLDLLLEAMRHVVAVEPLAKLLVVVTIPSAAHEQWLRRQAEQLGIAEHVLLTEPQALAGVPELLAACDVAVVPRPQAPGFPIKLLNYLAARRPCVLFASSASSGLVHRHNAFLVAPDTGRALGQALLELLGNSALRQQLGQNGYRYLCENHDRLRIAAQVVAVYRRLLAGAPPAPAPATPPAVALWPAPPMAEGAGNQPVTVEALRDVIA